MGIKEIFSAFTFVGRFVSHLMELVSNENCVGNCMLAERPKGSMSSIGSYGSRSCVIELKFGVWPGPPSWRPLLD